MSELALNRISNGKDILSLNRQWRSNNGGGIHFDWDGLVSEERDSWHAIDIPIGTQTSGTINKDISINFSSSSSDTLEDVNSNENIYAYSAQSSSLFNPISIWTSKENFLASGTDGIAQAVINGAESYYTSKRGKTLLPFQLMQFSCFDDTVNLSFPCSLYYLEESAFGRKGIMDMEITMKLITSSSPKIRFAIKWSYSPTFTGSVASDDKFLIPFSGIIVIGSYT